MFKISDIIVYFKKTTKNFFTEGNHGYANIYMLQSHLQIFNQGRVMLKK